MLITEPRMDEIKRDVHEIMKKYNPNEFEHFVKVCFDMNEKIRGLNFKEIKNAKV